MHAGTNKVAKIYLVIFLKCFMSDVMEYLFYFDSYDRHET